MYIQVQRTHILKIQVEKWIMLKEKREINNDKIRRDLLK